MKTIRTLVVLCIAILNAHVAFAYKESTHAFISEYSVEHSVIDEPAAGVLLGLGLGPLSGDRRFMLPTDSSPGTPQALVIRGAVAEDEGLRSLNHFYDPQRDGRGLPFPGSYPSPIWVLEEDPIQQQEFSYSDAKENLLIALTGLTEDIRSSALGGVFQDLGHVIHHVQDMAQPQHVRGDTHCEVPVPCKQAGLYRPSAYERYVADLHGDLPFDGYPIPNAAGFSGGMPFWADAGKGIAEFTSRNFVSVGTNFSLNTTNSPITIESDDDHPWPRGADVHLVSADINDPSFIRRVTDPQPMAGEISFAETPVVDTNAPEFNGSNRYASMLSIWYDSEVLGTGEVLAEGYPAFTLNSANYQAAADRLIPRATAYSTGLINYFFRGRIEIGLPEQGVYGVLDHATTYAARQGFPKLKLRLRNASGDGEHVPQTMQGGTLVAVAKYTLNSCYQPDLSGDFAARYDTGEVVWPANCSYDQYVSGEELISQSAAILASSLDTSATDFTFDFSSQPIPVNARDLRIQVVYSGQLGAEADGIAFGGRDISEPTYVVVYNNSDYFALDGKFYTPAEIRSDPAKAQRVAGINIDPKPLVEVALSVVSGKPLTSASGSVPVNGYVRVALLADRDEPITVNVLSRFEGTGYSIASFPGIPPNVTDLRSEDGYVTALGIFRGPRGNFFDVNFKTNADVPVSAEELTAMSTRMAADPGPTPIPLRF